MVSESRVTFSTSVPILVFLGLYVPDLGPMYATDRRQMSDRRASSLNVSYPRGGDEITEACCSADNFHRAAGALVVTLRTYYGALQIVVLLLLLLLLLLPWTVE